jgi:hypothetical protein
MNQESNTKSWEDVHKMINLFYANKNLYERMNGGRKDITLDKIEALKDWVRTHYTVKNFPDHLAGNLYWGCAIGMSFAAYEIGRMLGMDLEEPKWGSEL